MCEFGSGRDTGNSSRSTATQGRGHNGGDTCHCGCPWPSRAVTSGESAHETVGSHGLTGTVEGTAVATV